MRNSDPIFSAVLPNDLKLMVQLWNDLSLQPGETFQGSSWQHAFSKAQFFAALHMDIVGGGQNVFLSSLHGGVNIVQKLKNVSQVCQL